MAMHESWLRKSIGLAGHRRRAMGTAARRQFRAGPRWACLVLPESLAEPAANAGSPRRSVERGTGVRRSKRHALLPPRPAKLRRILAAIIHFQVQCRMKVDVQGLADAMASVLGLATDVRWRHGASSLPSDLCASENEPYLVELRGVLRALRANQDLTRFELTHAMDALIVYLVQITPNRSYAIRMRLRTGVKAITVQRAACC